MEISKMRKLPLLIKEGVFFFGKYDKIFASGFIFFPIRIMSICGQFNIKSTYRCIKKKLRH